MDPNKKNDIAKLIQIAKDNKKELFKKDLAADLHDSVSFALALDIKTGKNKVSTDTIYASYKEWAVDPISRVAFFRHFSRMFATEEIEKKVMYLINYKPAELMKEVNVLKGKYK